jgi:hypothetical protein
MLLSSCAEEDTKNKSNNMMMPYNISNKVSVKRYFSSNNKPDYFELELKGDNYTNAILKFSVLNYKHDTMFFYSVPVDSVIVCETKNEDTYRIKILEFMSTFFAETNFACPPYTINDPTKNNFPGDTLVWNEIKNDTTRWCFEFSLNKNINKLITYSANENAIVVYDYTNMN